MAFFNLLSTLHEERSGEYFLGLSEVQIIFRNPNSACMCIFTSLPLLCVTPKRVHHEIVDTAMC